MFVLRFTSEGISVNKELGNQYTYIDKLNDEKSFERALGRHKSIGGEVSDELYGFVIDANGDSHPLFKVNDNRILNSNGELFENISYGPK
jgi:hypothetical protein